MSLLAESPATDASPVPAASGDASFSGEVVCDVVAGRSALVRVRATDPLKLLTPATPGDAKHVVMSTYGGGLLGGDRVTMGAAVGAGAQLVLTTQSSTKVYRTDDRPGVQTLDATIADGGLLAVLSDPLCAYAGSEFEQRQQYDLSAGGNLVWLDWMSSGRHGRGERWVMRSIASRTTIGVAGQVRVRETLSLDAATGDIGSLMRTGRFDCYAVLAVVGPRLVELVDHARAGVRGVPLSPTARLLAADAALAGGAMFRILGPDAQTVRMLLRELLRPLDALLGHPPWGRKW